MSPGSSGIGGLPLPRREPSRMLCRGGEGGRGAGGGGGSRSGRSCAARFGICPHQPMKNAVIFDALQPITPASDCPSRDPPRTPHGALQAQGGAPGVVVRGPEIQACCGGSCGVALCLPKAGSAGGASAQFLV